MEFLDHIESVRVEEASHQRVFGGEGSKIRSLRKEDPRYQRAFTEALGLVEATVRGRKPIHYLQEAMSTSDFPLLFGDIIDRQMLGTYTEWPTQWSAIARRATVRDFRTVKRFKLDGAESVLNKVPQGTEYPEAAVTEGKYEYFVEKYGRRVPFLWEVFVNDDLDALRDTPNRLGKAARYTEDRFVTALFAASTGPNTTFFASGNGNLATAGAGSALSVASLTTAVGALRAQKDADGNPIFIENMILVVPPALEVTARNILNVTEIRTATGGGGTSAADQLVAKNWIPNYIQGPVVNPWLPIITTSGTIGNTAWYLFASPSAGRPALEVGFLRGNETPQLFLKSSNAVRIGGGVVAAEEGDFDTDSVHFKVRHILGGTLIEPKAAYASPGQ